MIEELFTSFVGLISGFMSGIKLFIVTVLSFISLLLNLLFDGAKFLYFLILRIPTYFEFFGTLINLVPSFFRPFILIGITFPIVKMIVKRL